MQRPCSIAVAAGGGMEAVGRLIYRLERPDNQLLTLTLTFPFRSPSPPFHSPSAPPSTPASAASLHWQHQSEGTPTYYLPPSPHPSLLPSQGQYFPHRRSTQYPPCPGYHSLYSPHSVPSSSPPSPSPLLTRDTTMFSSALLPRNTSLKVSG